MGKLARFFLAATAFTPIFLVYALISLVNGDWNQALVYSLIGVSWILLNLLILQFCYQHLQRMPFTTKTVRAADEDNLGFLLIYLLPLITGEALVHNWIEWAVVTVFLCLIICTSYGYHFNPVLTLFGYHFYRVTDKSEIPHILITKRRIHVVGEKLNVMCVADYVLMEERSK